MLNLVFQSMICNKFGRNKSNGSVGIFQMLIMHFTSLLHASSPFEKKD